MSITAQEIADEAAKLFSETESLDAVADMLHRHEEQGVPRATVVEAMGLIDKLLQRRDDDHG